MTKGENFGHTIYEALSASVPILISDQTPWRRLQEKNAGWDLSLEDPNKINSAIETAIKLNSVELRKMKKGAYQLASDYVHDSKRNEIALDLFRS